MAQGNSKAYELPDTAMACQLLDKLTLKNLHLIEEKMRSKVAIERSINNGSIHLAKSRYIMGQNSVCATRLPVETSPEFSASILCSSKLEDGVTQLQVRNNESDNTINPLRWFGVFVPQDLRKAQSYFQNSINYVVECINIQLQLIENLKYIENVNKFIKSQKPSE